jgi:O-antigen/teichoic acid export membrane protein
VRAEIRLAIIRLTGDVVFTYHYRMLYLGCYLLLILAMYFSAGSWPNVGVIFVAQLAAMAPSYTWLMIKQKRLMASSTESGGANGIWKEVWKVSSSERLNRGLQFSVGLVERPLLLGASGLAFVGSYDLLMRLMMIVSALPGALNQPMLAMLAHDAARGGSGRKFESTIRRTKLVTAASASVGVLAAMLAFTFFHEAIFGVTSLISPRLAILIAVSSGVNVLTAPTNAMFMARGIVWPCNLKATVEILGVAAACIGGWLWESGQIFITLRYAFLLVGAAGLLVVERTERKWHYA